MLCAVIVDDNITLCHFQKEEGEFPIGENGPVRVVTIDESPEPVEAVYCAEVTTGRSSWCS